MEPSVLTLAPADIWRYNGFSPSLDALGGRYFPLQIQSYKCITYIIHEQKADYECATENKPCYHHSTSAPLDLQGLYTINLKQKYHPLQTNSKTAQQKNIEWKTFTSSCVWRFVSLYRIEDSASLITISRAINSSWIFGYIANHSTHQLQRRNLRQINCNVSWNMGKNNK